MSRLERFFVFWALGYLAGYIGVLLFLGRNTTFWLSGGNVKTNETFALLMFFHILGMVQNFLAMFLTIRDLYLRSFPRENQKLTWLLLILCTGGIGWIVYVFKHAIKPRESR